MKLSINDPKLTAYALGEIEKPPHILHLALQSKSWGSLPEAGGLLDQPAGLIDNMTLAYNVFLAHKEMQSAENLVQWMEQNPEQAEVIRWVKELRDNGRK